MENDSTEQDNRESAVRSASYFGGVTSIELDELEEQQQVSYMVSSGKAPLREVQLLEERPLSHESGVIILDKHPTLFRGNTLLRFKWTAPYSPDEYQVGMASSAAGEPNMESTAKAIMSAMDMGTNPTLLNAMAPAGLLGSSKCDGFHVVYRIEVEYNERDSENEKGVVGS